MKPLIAIVTCHRYKDRADAQRATWIKEATQIDYKFFLGSKGIREPGSDEVILDAPDDYTWLSVKVRGVMRWAREHGYDAVLKCDDDTFIFPERLVNNLPKSLFEGRINNSNKALAPGGWCSGFAYWLAGRSIDVIASAPEPTCKAEDLWVGSTLNAHGITPVSQPNFVALSIISPRLWHTYRSRLIAACEFPAGRMFEIYRAMHSTTTPEEVLRDNPRLGLRIAKFGQVLRRR